MDPVTSSSTPSPPGPGNSEPGPDQRQQTTSTTVAVTETAEREPRTLLGLSMPSLAGGALASVTAAVLASRLGVSGTVMGAAFGSVVSAMGGAVYTHSLNRAQEQVVTLTRTVLPGSAPSGSDAPGSPASAPASPSAPAVGSVGSAGSAAATVNGSTSEQPAAAGRRPRRSAGEKRRMPSWKVIVGAAVAMFVITMAAITVFEQFVGQPISDVGRTTTGNSSGTTFGSLTGGGDSSSDPSPSPSSSDGQESPSASTGDQSATPSDSSSTETSPAASDGSSPQSTQQTDQGNGSGDNGGAGTPTPTGDGAVSPTASAQP